MMKTLKYSLFFAAITLAGCNAEGVTDSGDAGVSTGAGRLARCTVVDQIPADQHMVTSWKTAPTDALITHPITALTVRESFAPHRGGTLMRLRLSNRYSTLPVTLDSVHIAKEAIPGKADMLPDSECLLTFSGRSRITIPAGESVLSDTMAYPIRAFERVGISFFAPEATVQITRHLS
ncbi:MAG: hypothetical protein ABIM24_02100, partial [Paraperlucidibaca sp.]